MSGWGERGGVVGSFFCLYCITCFRAFWTLFFLAIVLVGKNWLFSWMGGTPLPPFVENSAKIINLIFEPFPRTLKWRCLVIRTWLENKKLKLIYNLIYISNVFTLFYIFDIGFRNQLFGDKSQKIRSVTSQLVRIDQNFVAHSTCWIHFTVRD